MSKDTYNIDNRGGIFNLHAALTNVNQTISSAENIDATDREKFQSLLAELETALQPVVEQKPAEAERLVGQVEGAAKEMALPNPDKSFLKLTIRGIEKAANLVKNVAPAVLDVTGKIIDFVNKYV